MDETVFLQSPGVRISSSRIDLGKRTFAVRNVGSVRVERAEPKWTAGAVSLLVAAAMASSSAWVGAIMFGALGAGLIWRGLPKSKLVLMAGGGEVVALESRDAAAMEALREAVAKAISVR